ncbi:sensor histidine kinase [Flavilitoribacter nigricans]|uniref:histidine kinase n=1 Tax=Flavilitoribacter nigricans (strain ATCC 23147 / DSM 23189 / NBRC 102662 / NCIMB 1420 / SS-2) TaxID=1122177 RepID=A0A2D0NHC1_FLAN2|nr:ATP-binding protein [Flavilitoribacter nigricans]PHN07892.1 hypothetical protein CRP01_03830 [Flavilitoribacter nigricans DSM 23189 = NBRC 102662]
MEFFQKLFETDFMPHGHCYFWRPEILWPHVLGDVFTSLAYFVIPLLLYRFVKARPDVKYPGVFLAFSLFILCCGITHLLATVSVWQPIYRAEAVAKVTTAMVSMGTVGMLFKLYKPILAIPSPAQLEQANVKLNEEITQRERMEEKLRIRKESFRTTMKYAPAGMALVSPQGKWLQVNPALCKMLGYSEKELLRTDVAAVTHPEDLDRYQSTISELSAGMQEGVFLEKRSLHKNGNVIWAMLGISAVFDENDKLLHFIVQILDISARKKHQEEITALNASLEEKVKERTAQLQEVNEELESFSYAVSHDLRAPLKNMEGMASMLQDLYAPQLDENGAILIDHINTNAKRMDRLITDFLNFSRVGQQVLQKEQFDIQALFEEVYHELSPHYPEKKIDLQIESLPAAYGDPGLLRQVVQNLLSNALKYSSGREEIVIRVKGSDESGQTVYTVTDNGVGFDHKFQKKLFMMFQRLHKAEHFSGHGIGLAFSYRIVKKHGGNMWAESKVDQGAKFHFSLPKS